MLRTSLAIALLLAAACRGEPVPRDYQNNPPAMTNPVDKAEQAPAPQSSTVVPEPSYGAEGTSAPYEPTKPSVAPGKPTGTPATTPPTQTQT